MFYTPSRCYSYMSYPSGSALDCPSKVISGIIGISLFASNFLEGHLRVKDQRLVQIFIVTYFFILLFTVFFFTNIQHLNCQRLFVFIGFTGSVFIGFLLSLGFKLDVYIQANLGFRIFILAYLRCILSKYQCNCLALFLSKFRTKFLSAKYAQSVVIYMGLRAQFKNPFSLKTTLFHGGRP